MKLKVLAKDDLRQKVAVVVGTRPGIVKQSPTIRALKAAGIDFFVIHTGQHYSYEMDARFFEDLQLPKPKYRLENVHNYWTHGGQTAEMLKGIEEALLEERPRVVIVGGDANTNLAGALAARKLQLLVGHVEAGLRSGDWRMPEEHNRVMIDHISDYLFAPTADARANLEADRVRGQIFVTGNTIVDAVYQNLDLAAGRTEMLAKLGLEPGRYFLMTVHREETVDSAANLEDLVDTVLAISEAHPDRPVVFPIHPRTEKRLDGFGLRERLARARNLQVIPPTGYLDFLMLTRHAGVILTDSGGIQEEACILRVPCVTLRESTERPETVAIGANVVAGLRAPAVLQAIDRAHATEPAWEAPYGDGHAAERIIEAIRDEVSAA